MPSRMAQDMGWKDESGGVFGEHAGVLYTLRNVYHSRYDTRLHVFLLLPGLTDEQRAAFVQELKDSRKQMRNNGAAFVGDEMDIDVGGFYRTGFTGRLKTEKLREFLGYLSSYIAEQRLCSPGACYVCGGASADAFALRGLTAAHIHDACYDKLVSDMAEQKAQYRSPADKRYLRGLLVALLFALVAAAIHTIVYPIAAEYIGFGGITAILIGWGAAWGYRVGGGKAGPLTLPVLLLVWLASLGLFAFVLDSAYVLYQMGEAVTAANILDINAGWATEDMLPFLAYNGLFSFGALLAGFAWLREKVKAALPSRVKRIV